ERTKANQKDEKGWTPLHWAAQMGNQAMAEILIQNGANKKASTPQGLKPWQIAYNRGYKKLALLLGMEDDKKVSQPPSPPTITFPLSQQVYLWEKKGKECYQRGQYQEAIQWHQKACQGWKKLGNLRQVSQNLRKIGYLYHRMDQIDKAYFYYKKAMKFGFSGESSMEKGKVYNNLALLCLRLRKYGESLKYLKQAWTVFENSKNKSFQRSLLRNLGLVYYKLGQWKWSLYYYRKCLALAQKEGNSLVEAEIYLLLGTVYDNIKDWKRLYEANQKALEIGRRQHNQEIMARAQMGLGGYYSYKKQFDEALKCYRYALDYCRQKGEALYEAFVKENMGHVYHRMGQERKSLALLQEAYHIYLKRDPESVPKILKKIGRTYWNLGEYNKGILAVFKAIQLYEEMRKSIRGKNQALRRDFLAKILATYQTLIRMYIQAASHFSRTRPLYLALQTMEWVRGKYLLESMSMKESQPFLPLSMQEIQSFQKKMKSHQGILYYYFTDRQLVSICMNRKGVYAVRVKDIGSYFGKRLGDISFYQNLVKKNLKTRGLKVTFHSIRKETKKKAKTSLPYSWTLLLQAYHALLQNPYLQGKEKALFRRLSSLFYDLLIKSFDKHPKAPLKKITDLLIIPQGLLSYLPFETLITEDGKYLAEKYKISYAISLSLVKFLKK
ncbi:MAG: CHAT domain-containing protein, partial [Planctomycetota bacterium]